MAKVPEYVRVGLVARLCRMETRDMRRMLAGLLVRYRGQRFWVPTDRLRHAFPEAYTKLYQHYEERTQSRTLD